MTLRIRVARQYINTYQIRYKSLGIDLKLRNYSIQYVTILITEFNLKPSTSKKKKWNHA